VAIEFLTGRGRYRLVAVTPLEVAPGKLALTAALEQGDGLERVAIRFSVLGHRSGEAPAYEQLLSMLGSWLEGAFEQTREAALKSIRSERKLLEIVFDRANPGPFDL
jgi:hypothetical protein